MAKDRKPKLPKILSDEQVEELFSSLDETGHVDPALAADEHENRRTRGVGLPIDPLSGKDPSGSNVNKVIQRTAVLFVCITLAVILVAQVSCGVARRATAGSLAADVTVESVASSLRSGVEWGSGFTQFPEEFSVQEADEATGRIEVTVVDTTSENELQAMAGSYIQATAFATNALLNPDIDTVIYRVNAHEGEDGKFQTAHFFGFLQPTGPVKSFMTFIFTKATSASGGFNIFCTITGLDEATTQSLREKIGSGPLDIFTDTSSGTGTAAEDKTANANANGGASAAGTDDKAAEAVPEGTTEADAEPAQQ